MPATSSNQTGTPLGIEDVKPQPNVATDSVGDNDQNDHPDNLPASVDEAQQGIRNVEAVTLTWTKTSLAMAFIKYHLHLHYTVWFANPGLACGACTLSTHSSPLSQTP